MTSLQVADPPKSTSDGMQYMNLPNKSNDNRMSGDGGHTENNPSVSHCASAEGEITVRHI